MVALLQTLESEHARIRRGPGGDGPAALAAGLTSPEAEVRNRAVLLIAQKPDDEATALLAKVRPTPSRC
ncbi:hypothetical protein [Jiangella alba]|uniref:Uncharacterized protein n=1 Tax=Jiangella alba TaxID=561176 RepID=A0A1H5JI32_9ACTN|nr:hypothetical protein [Jiangella alba]SEE51298.1 hypothetical protein SAMN04488561_1565 [Jiangella alba]